MWVRQARLNSTCWVEPSLQLHKGSYRGPQHIANLTVSRPSQVLLPESLKGSYARYKDDTDRFATWLLYAASKCGYEPDLPLSNDSSVGTVPGHSKSSSSSKSSSESKAIANDVLEPISPKYKATVSELRKLGQVVARSGMRVPLSVLALARRAIALRKDAAACFVDKGNTASDKRHAYIMRVLEEICESLGWEISPSFKSKSSAKKGINGDGEDDPDSQAWLNRFAALTIEEPEDIVESLPASTKVVKVELVQDDLSEDEKEEAYLSIVFFEVFCLFRDLRNVREFISQTWIEYRDNKLDLMTASVVTNTALQLTRGMIQDFTDNSPLQNDKLPIQEAVYNTIAISRGRTGQDIAPSVEIGLTFHKDMADVANWCYIPTRTLLQSFIPMIQDSNVPVFNKGYFGTYNPKADRSKLSIGEQFREDRMILLETLPEFCLLAAFGSPFPVQDELTLGLIEFVKSKKPSFWLSFAIQNFLDVHHIMRSSRLGVFDDLRMCGLRISKIIDDFKALSSTHRKPAFWPRKWDKKLDAIQDQVKLFPQQDPMKELWKMAGRVQHDRDHFLFRQHSVICGLLMFHLNLRMQTMGQGLVNSWYDVRQLAFLYNLAQQVPDTRLAWPDIEIFIRIHGEKHIFVGGRPKNASESLNRLELATQGAGISSVPRFARDAQQDTNAWHAPGAREGRKLELTTRTAELFRDRYTLVNERRNLSNSDIDKLMSDLTSIAKRGKYKPLVFTLNPKDLASRKWSSRHTLGALQFLALVKSKLHEEEPVLMFNYFGMHRRCIEILRLIRAKEHDRFVQYFKEGYLPRRVAHLEPGHNSALAGEQMGLAAPKKGAHLVSRIIMSCSEVMEDFLKTKGDVACKELRTFCKNKAPLLGAEQDQADEGVEKIFKYWFLLEEVMDPKAMASLMTCIPVA